MKFIIDRMITDTSVHFDDPLKAERSPLAAKIFGFPWAAAVFIGPNFVTITKQEWVEWEILAEPLSHIIAEHVENGEAILLPESTATSEDDANDSPVVRQIKHLLNTEIRPAVAMDGGDIVFHKYEDQVVYLYMQGACSGCPSSTLTLKAGIESRLRDAIPEIKEVVSL